MIAILSVFGEVPEPEVTWLDSSFEEVDEPDEAIEVGAYE